MAAVAQPSAVYVHGVTGTLTNCSVQSFTNKEAAANVSQVEDEGGNQVERRYDDITDDATVEIIIKSAFTPPTVGAKFTYNAVDYEVVSIDRKEQNKSFVMLTLTIKKSQYITPA